MKIEDFESSPAGRLVRIAGFDPRHQAEYVHVAFVPIPLPSELEQLGFSGTTWSAVNAATLALGRLDQATGLVPNPAILERPTIRREAQSTSALEGTITLLSEVLEAEVEPEVGVRPELREVLNFVRVSELAYIAVADRPISIQLLSELQGLLVEGTRDDGPDAGRVRERQVVIGPEGCPITEARFVPPPPDFNLQDGLREWERWINTPNHIPIVAQLALGHYQFEALHPFSNGNGRIGRLVMLLQLLRSGTLHSPLLPISPWLETRRGTYQEHLLAVSKTGDFDPWVRFIAEGVAAQSDGARSQIQHLLDFQEEVRELARKRVIGGVAVQLANDLIGNPIVHVRWVADRFGVTYQGASYAIQKLRDRKSVV